MRAAWWRAMQFWRAEARLLTAMLALAGLLLMFGHLACGDAGVAGTGRCFASDRPVMEWLAPAFRATATASYALTDGYWQTA